MNLGMKVVVKFTNGRSVTLRNVTEIHYCYPSIIDEKWIAFESDIHYSGVTYPVSMVAEFETALENFKAVEF